MSFLSLTIAVCFGVFAGTSFYKGVGGLVYWFQNRFPAPEDAGEKIKTSKRAIVLLSVSLMLASVALIYLVKSEESNKLARINEAPKAVSVGEEPLKSLPPLKLLPPPMEVMPPPAPAPRFVEATPSPALEPVVPAPAQEIVPVKRYKPRVIYIDGRKGYIRNISVFWEGGEAFEDVDIQGLPFASQLVPLPPRPHYKKR